MKPKQNPISKPKRMTFPYDKIQCCRIFLNKKVFFHHGACVPANELFQQYLLFMESLGLEEHIVKKHQLWALIKTCVPDDIKSSLNKRISGKLFYLGLDLQDHAISDSTIQHLIDRGIPVEFTENILSNDQKVADLAHSLGETISDIPTVLPRVEMSKASLRETPVDESLAQVLNLDQPYSDSRVEKDSTVLSYKPDIISIRETEPGETPAMKRARGRPRKVRHENEMKSHHE
jgi:hypothetical protein